MDAHRLFADIEDSTRSPRPSRFFTLNCILFSRAQPRVEGVRDAFDDDVDLYLARLRQACSSPADAEGLAASLSKYDADVFRRLRGSADASLKYLILRAADDFLLVSVGVFDQPADPRQKKCPPAEDATIGRGRAYYEFAYTYGQQLHRQDTVLSEVLEKLSVGFEKYATILSHLRGERFDLAGCFASGEFHHVDLTVSEEGRRLLLHEREDRFLETYAEWRRTGGEELKAALRRQAEEIRQLKPDFRFTV